MRKLAVLVLLILVFVPASYAEDESVDEQVETILQNMTLEEKVGQMFMVSIFGKALGESGQEFIEDYRPGAVAIFGYNTDFEPASQVARFINQMQEVSINSGSGIPMIVATDQEGGRVRRIINDVTFFPDPLWLGAITNLDSISQVGQVTGAELNEIGVNMNLAPVADLHVRADMMNEYRVMHRRTFGDDPLRVGEQVAAYTDGLAQAGVIGVAKHFPGHGGAADSHAGLPAIDTDFPTASQGAFRAFEVAVEHDIPAIMAGHLYYSQIEPIEGLPSTLSPTLLGILRDDFAFEGIIMTDAMDMGALADNFFVPDAALMAVEAGIDMVVVGPYMAPETQRASMQRIIDAVNNGELPESRIDESVRRILQLKARYGILDWEPQDPETIIERIDREASLNVLLESFMDAATVVRDEEGLLPLTPEDNVAIVYPISYTFIGETCREIAPDATYSGYNFQPADWEYGVVSRLGREHDKVVIFVEDALLNLRQLDLVKTLPPEKTILVALSLPYDLEGFSEASTYMAMYNSLPASHSAACYVLFGKHPAEGRLPISVGEYASGSGVNVGRID